MTTQKFAKVPTQYVATYLIKPLQDELKHLQERMAQINAILSSVGATAAQPTLFDDAVQHPNKPVKKKHNGTARMERGKQSDAIIEVLKAAKKPLTSHEVTAAALKYIGITVRKKKFVKYHSSISARVKHFTDKKILERTKNDDGEFIYTLTTE